MARAIIRGVAVLLLMVLITTSVGLVLAWDPSTMVDLSGTDSSSASPSGGNKKYDITTSTGSVYGIQTGDDTDSIALQIRLVKGGFSATGMASGDQYELNFTIGSEDFNMLFVASGTNAGTCKLFYKASGGSSWSSGDSLSQSGITSGTTYTSVSENIGFRLTSSTQTTVGYVKLIVKKSYLFSLGASGSQVTNIVATTYSGANGQPGGGTTALDRCPSTGTASWTLSGDIPEFPLGALVLAVPVVVIYLYMRRRSGAGLSTHVRVPA